MTCSSVLRCFKSSVREEQIMITQRGKEMTRMLFKINLELNNIRNPLLCATGIVFALIIAFASFNFNIFKVINKDSFSSFQYDSEALVLGSLIATERGLKFPDGFHLGSFSWYYPDQNAVYENINKSLPDLNVAVQDQNDSNWEHGINKKRNKILIAPQACGEAMNYLGRNLIIEGNVYQILRINQWGSPWLEVRGSITVQPNKMTSVILSGNPIENTLIQPSAYRSQVGIQGAVFSALAKFGCSVKLMYAINSLLLSFLVVAICWNYKALISTSFAVCLYLTMVLSPWLVPFARNLYWVPWTWFIPALLVILIINSRNGTVKYTLWCLLPISTCFKSMAGYEYLSTIILFAAAPYAILFLNSKTHDDRLKCCLGFINVCLLCSLGFAIAFLYHASLRADTVLNGIKSIYYMDIKRRTYGSAENFAAVPVLAESLKASAWSVVKTYIFEGHRSWLYGIKINYAITGAMLGIVFMKLHYESVRKFIVLFFVFLIAPISWYVLGKAHSYIHTHLNYVLWTFGFSAVCLWIYYMSIVKAMKLLKNRFFK